MSRYRMHVAQRKHKRTGCGEAVFQACMCASSIGSNLLRCANPGRIKYISEVESRDGLSSFH